MMDQLLLIFIGISIIAGVGYKLLNKYVMKNAEPYAFSLVTQVFSAAVFFILAYNKLAFPNDARAWITLAVASILWTIISISVFISYKHSDVSLREPLSQAKIVLAFVLGALFLGESASLNRVFGMIAIFIGVTILVYKPGKGFHLSDPGVRWTLFAAFLSAVVAIVDKYALSWFNVETYAFVVFFVPMLILLCFLPNRTKQVRHLMKTKGYYALLAIILSGITYYFTLKAYSIADITVVYPLLHLTTLFAVLGGMIFMGERNNVWQKIISTIMVIAGSVIIIL